VSNKHHYARIGNRVYALRRFETEEELEHGGTSRPFRGKPAPLLRDFLFKQGYIKPGMKVLDYGAGVNARNADFLRSQGCEVYAYDPFHETQGTGWEPGSVVKALPPSDTRFDAGFSSFVLNVVSEAKESEILADMEPRCSKVYHLVRNKEVWTDANKALRNLNPSRAQKIVVDFFLNYFADEDEKQRYHDGTLTDEDIRAFSEFGYQTTSGFQRIPSDLLDKGYTMIKGKETSPQAIYAKE
jgi:hypothetical protein